MKTDKKATIIILIISFIIIALLVLLIIKGNLYKVGENDKKLGSCSLNNKIKCIYYDKDGFTIIKDNNEYYINDYLAGNYSCKFEISEVQKDNFIIIDTGCGRVDFKIFNKDGQLQSFPEINAAGGLIAYDYDGNYLTLKGGFDILASSKEEACNFKPLNIVVYIEEKIEVKNGRFGDPMIVSTIELKDYLRDFYGFDCENN